MIAVDVATRMVYASQMADKSVDSIIMAFSDITSDLGPENTNVPAMIDTDQERGWTKSAEWKEYLEGKGIAQRFKVDRFAPNSLGMVDNVISRLKNTFDVV